MSIEIKEADAPFVEKIKNDNISFNFIKEVENQLQEHISKDKLTEIIDGLHLQMVWVWLAIDSLDAIKTIDKVKIKRAQNFMYITHSSLIYRYSMELAKLFDQGDGLCIYRIRNMCLQNKGHFDSSFDIEDYCENFKKALGQYNSLIKNITERRRKTYAHNDKDYYLFNQKAIDDFPLDMQEIKDMANIIYNFAKTMQEKIGSKRANLGYPANSDDVKRLFGEKTDADIWLEDNEDCF